MSKLKCRNGYTKETMIARVKRAFKGKSIKAGTWGGDTCAYRGTNGAKCAVGMFIPNSIYDVEMDQAQGDTDIVTVIGKFPELKKVLPLSVSSLRKFQQQHDELPDLLSVKEQKKTLIKWIMKNIA